jgi:hypothetical protein
MSKFKLSNHFIKDVQPKRQYLTLDILEQIICNPVKTEIQADNRTKFWGFSSVYNKFIRVVLLEDGETILTAFFDRDFSIKGE